MSSVPFLSPVPMLPALEWRQFAGGEGSCTDIMRGYIAHFFLGVTTVLSMTTLMIGSRTSLPNTNCFIKAIDVYLGICFSFVFGALLEYAVAHYSSLQQMAAKDRVRIWELYVIHHLCHMPGLSGPGPGSWPPGIHFASDSHPCSMRGIWQSGHLFKKTTLFANEILICLIF